MGLAAAFLVPQGGGSLKILAAHSLFLFLSHLGDLVLQLFHVRRGGHVFQPGPAGGFIHQIQGFVGQPPVGNIPGGHFHGGPNGLVGDFYFVMGLVFIPQAQQDFFCVLLRGFFHHHRLKPPLQSGVFFNMLPVFVDGGGADHLQIPAGQSGLQDVGGVHRPFGRAGPYHHVHFVDEQNHVFGLDHLFDGGLNSFFKFAPVLGAGHHTRQIQRNQPLSRNGFGHVAGHNFLGQALGDGGFAHAGLADESRVVFLPTGENLDDPLNLLIPADHRVQPVFPSLLGQVCAELTQGFQLALALGALLRPGQVGGLAAHGLLQRPINGPSIGAHRLEDAQAVIVPLPD